jgi:diaminopimelate epimerase
MFPNTSIISNNFITEGLDDESQFSNYVNLFIRCVDNQTQKLNNLGRSHLACLVLVYEKGLGLGCHCGSCACGCCTLLVLRCGRRNSCNVLEYSDDEINRRYSGLKRDMD